LFTGDNCPERLKGSIKNINSFSILLIIVLILKMTMIQAFEIFYNSDVGCFESI